MERIELGCAGHLTVASRCQFRRHTQVGDYRISTMGDYIPTLDDGKREEIGAGRFFETMVFKTTGELDPENEGCGCRFISDYSALDGDAYNTAGDAQSGHEKMVEKYTLAARAEKGEYSTRRAAGEE